MSGTTGHTGQKCPQSGIWKPDNGGKELALSEGGHERIDEQRRAQAARVVIWPYASEPHPELGTVYRSIEVRNRSDLPIYGMRLTLTVPGHGINTVWERGLLLPGEREGITLPRDAPVSENESSDPHLNPVKPEGVRLRFGDAANRRWDRSARGELEKVPTPSP